MPSISDSIHAPALICSREAPGFQDGAVTEADLAAINQLSAAPLRADQVFVRSMYLCSTQPCAADGCQFTFAALQQISRLIVGQSVLPGHDRRSLPLARFYRAEVVQRNSDDGDAAHFVRAWFYWLRDTSGANDLLLNIDGGIYREVSLAWKFNQWRCSICGAQNNQCSHRPSERYGERTCYRLIDAVTEVLEGSLVYKSADRSTNVTGMRSADDDPALVMLVADASDAVFSYLNERGLLDDVAPTAEWDKSLGDGAESIWLRDKQNAASEQIERTLMEKSVLLHEQLKPGAFEGALTASQRQGDALRAIPIQEEAQG